MINRGPLGVYFRYMPRAGVYLDFLGRHFIMELKILRHPKGVAIIHDRYKFNDAALFEGDIILYDTQSGLIRKFLGEKIWPDTRHQIKCQPGT